MSFKKLFENNFFVFGILLLVGLCVYGNVIFGAFVFDDNLLVENNRLIRSLGNFLQFFVSNSQSGAGLEGSNFYRPLQYLVYAINFQFFGLSEISFHFTSVFLHIVNGFLLFLFLQKLNFSRVGSFFAGLFFLIHPVNTEAVAYVSGIADPLGFCFLFLGLLSFVSLKKLEFWGIFKTFLFFVLALLSKESTVIFAPLALLVTLFSWKKLSPVQKKLYPSLLVGCFLLMSFYLVLKFTVFNFTGNLGLTGQENLYTQNIGVRFMTFMNVLWEYVVMMVFPHDLYLERPYQAYSSLLTLRGIFGLSLLFGGLILAYRSFFRKRIFWLGFFWFFISLAPLSGIIPLNAMYLEHWMYFPLIGVLILLVGSFDVLKSKKLGVLFLVILGLGFSVRSIIRNGEWADPQKFYLNEIAYAPNSARIRNNLAMEYAAAGKFDLAISQYQKAIELRDDYPQTHHNLGNLYYEQGKFKMAEKEFLLALKMNPNFMYSYSGLLQIYQKTEALKFKKVQDFLQKIQQQKPVTEAAFQSILNLSNEE